ncbi:hypothetical protein FBQ97_07875 [Acidobacteria bacterium ACD]|nr:hypothetical protein [Acidobacteria bacterium ACD]
MAPEAPGRGRPGGVLRGLPRARARDRAPRRGQRPALQPRLRAGHGDAPRRRDRDRRRPPLGVGPGRAPRGGGRRRGHGGFLPLEGSLLRGRALRHAAFAVALVAAGPARAHLVNTGLGPLYDGVSHFCLTPEDLLPALALALLGGQGGARSGRLTLFALTGAWLAGGLAGLVVPVTGTAIALTTASFVLLGALVAAEARPRGAWAVALPSAFGLLHGYLNGSAMAEARLGALGLAGIVASLFVVVALAAATVVALRAPWTRIAVRVAGSWIAAVGLLLLGWALRKG